MFIFPGGESSEDCMYECHTNRLGTRWWETDQWNQQSPWLKHKTSDDKIVCIDVQERKNVISCMLS